MSKTIVVGDKIDIVKLQEQKTYYKKYIRELESDLADYGNENIQLKIQAKRGQDLLEECSHGFTQIDIDWFNNNPSPIVSKMIQEVEKYQEGGQPGDQLSRKGSDTAEKTLLKEEIVTIDRLLSGRNYDDYYDSACELLARLKKYKGSVVEGTRWVAVKKEHYDEYEKNRTFLQDLIDIKESWGQGSDYDIEPILDKIEEAKQYLEKGSGINEKGSEQ